MLREIQERIDEAREVIDGEMNCQTPEYRAVDALCKAVDLMHTVLTAHRNAIDPLTRGTTEAQRLANKVWRP